jgi:hypothetical protein
MQFKVTYSKLANFYFFIQNLSEWHSSNRKDYNALWRKELGEFSAREEAALGTFKEIRLKYKPSRTPFERAFFTARNPWQDLKNSLTAEEYQTIREIFDLFENKFTALWNKEASLINQWQKILKRAANDRSLLNPITSILTVLFSTSPPKKEIGIHLLLSAPNHIGGGANIDQQRISLEISRYPMQNVNQAIGIIWHETIHLCFQNQYFFPLILKQFPDDQQKADLINEIAISSLFPGGILGTRLLKNKPTNQLTGKVNPKQTIKILSLMEKYIDYQKPLDEKYIVRLAEILKI